MNTPAAFELLEVLIDEYGTGELSKNQKAHWLNLAIRDYIQDRIKPKQDQKGYSFNVDNRIRSEFKDLYVGFTALSVVSTNVYALPSDFKYPGRVRVKTTASGNDYRPCDITTPAKADDLAQDPFVDKGFEPFAELTTTGIVINSGEEDGSDISSVQMSYLKEWTDVSYGDPVAAASLPITNGTVIYVTSGSLTYKAVTYTSSQSFTTDGTGAITGSGQGAIITNAELSDDVMRECIRKAAYTYLIAMDQLNQAQAMMANELNS